MTLHHGKGEEVPGESPSVLDSPNEAHTRVDYQYNLVVYQSASFAHEKTDFSDYQKFLRIYNFFKNGLAKKSIFQRFSLKIPN